MTTCWRWSMTATARVQSPTPATELLESARALDPAAAAGGDPAEPVAEPAEAP